MIRADLVVEGASQVVTCEPAGAAEGLGVIPRGAVAAHGERIAWVGPAGRLAAEVELAPGARRLDAGRPGRPPGLRRFPHAPVFAGSREQEYAQRARGASYQEIAAAGGGILSTVRATRAATVDELVRLARPRLGRALAHGTTTCEVKSGYGLTTADEIKMLEATRRLGASQPVEVQANFCGAHEVPPEFRGRTDAYVDLVVNEMLPAVAPSGGWPSTSTSSARRASSRSPRPAHPGGGRRRGLRAKFHADEFATLGGAELAAEVRRAVRRSPARRASEGWPA